MYCPGFERRREGERERGREGEGERERERERGRGREREREGEREGGREREPLSKFIYNFNVLRGSQKFFVTIRHSSDSTKAGGG